MHVFQASALILLGYHECELRQSPFAGWGIGRALAVAGGHVLYFCFNFVTELPPIPCLCQATAGNGHIELASEYILDNWGNRSQFQKRLLIRALRLVNGTCRDTVFRKARTEHEPEQFNCADQCERRTNNSARCHGHEMTLVDCLRWSISDLIASGGKLELSCSVCGEGYRGFRFRFSTAQLVIHFQLFWDTVNPYDRSTTTPASHPPPPCLPKSPSYTLGGPPEHPTKEEYAAPSRGDRLLISQIIRRSGRVIASVA